MNKFVQEYSLKYSNSAIGVFTNGEVEQAVRLYDQVPITPIVSKINVEDVSIGIIRTTDIVKIDEDNYITINADFTCNGILIGMPYCKMLGYTISAEYNVDSIEYYYTVKQCYIDEVKKMLEKRENRYRSLNKKLAKRIIGE